MDALLRELREGPDGIAEYYDTEIASKELTIGSAADRNIQLLGRGIAPQHAMIVLAGSQLMLECRRGEIVRLNGKKRASAKLNVGDVIELAGHRLLSRRKATLPRRQATAPSRDERCYAAEATGRP